MVSQHFCTEGVHVYPVATHEVQIVYCQCRKFVRAQKLYAFQPTIEAPYAIDGES